MGRLYSGNLNDFKAACNRLYQLDLAVIAVEQEGSPNIKATMYLRIEDRAGRIIAQEEMYHCDEDVLYNMCTAWLNRMYDQLKDWK